MKTLMMLSNDNFFAKEDGSVDFGVAEDKLWLQEQIKDKVVLIGYNTFESIKKYSKLLSLAEIWIIKVKQKIDPNINVFLKGYNNILLKNEINTKFIDINFGGIKTILEFPSEKIIVNKMNINVLKGIPFPIKFFNDYEITGIVKKRDYNQIYYKRK